MCFNFQGGDEPSVNGTPEVNVVALSPTAQSPSALFFQQCIRALKQRCTTASAGIALKYSGVSALFCIVIHYAFDGVWPAIEDAMDLDASSVDLSLCGEIPVSHLFACAVLLLSLGYYGYESRKMYHADISPQAFVFQIGIILVASFSVSCLLKSVLPEDFSSYEVSLSLGDFAHLLIMSCCAYLLGHCFDFFLSIYEENLVRNKPGRERLRPSARERQRRS